jgi:hypothetical protein
VFRHLRQCVHGMRLCEIFISAKGVSHVLHINFNTISPVNYSTVLCVRHEILILDFHREMDFVIWFLARNAR